MPAKGMEALQDEARERGEAFLEKQQVSPENGYNWVDADHADPALDEATVAQRAAAIEAYIDQLIPAYAEWCRARPGTAQINCGQAGVPMITSSGRIEIEAGRSTAGPAEAVPVEEHDRLIREARAAGFSKGNTAAEARARFEVTGAIMAILARAADEAAEKAAATHVFEGERVKYGYHARQIRKLLEEIGAL